MAGFTIGHNTTTSMPVYPDYVQGPMEDYYGALSGTGMLGRASGYQSDVAPFNANLGIAYNAANGMLSSNKNYASTVLGSGQLQPGDIGQFIDPYATAVGGDTMKAITDSYNDERTRAGAQAASGVAFGGSGSGLALERAQLARSEAKDKSAAMNGILSQAYQQGATLADNNAGRGLQAAIGADNAATNYANRGSGAVADLLRTGGVRQNYDQSVADLPYTDLTRFLSLLQGSPQGTSETQPVTFDPISALLTLATLPFRG